jgi:hypothetical protein
MLLSDIATSPLGGAGPLDSRSVAVMASVQQPNQAVLAGNRSLSFLLSGWITMKYFFERRAQ